MESSGPPPFSPQEPRIEWGYLWWERETQDFLCPEPWSSGRIGTSGLGLSVKPFQIPTPCSLKVPWEGDVNFFLFMDTSGSSPPLPGLGEPAGRQLARMSLLTPQLLCGRQNPAGTFHLASSTADLGQRLLYLPSSNPDRAGQSGHTMRMPCGPELLPFWNGQLKLP